MIALTEINDAVFGRAALSIFESLILSLLEEGILDEEMVKELLEDASESHRHSRQVATTSSEEIVVASTIDRFSRTLLTIHQGRSPARLWKNFSGRKYLMKGADIMTDNVYSVTELVGSSSKSIEDAVQQAVKRAAKSIRNLDWFETKEIRGHIQDDEIVHYQVVLKLGFRYED